MKKGHCSAGLVLSSFAWPFLNTMAAVMERRVFVAELNSYLSDQFKNKIFPAFALKQLKKSSTVESYVWAVNSVCAYCKKDFMALEKSELQDYFNLLLNGKIKTGTGRTYSYKSVYTQFSSLRALSSYIQLNAELFDVAYSSPFVSVDLKEPSADITAEQILSADNIDTLLQAAGSDTQMYLILSLVLVCGFSTSELISIKPNQLVLDKDGRLSVSFVKRNNELRYVKVPDSLKDKLLLHAEPAVRDNREIFLNKQGKAYTRRVLDYTVRAFLDKAGLPGWTLSDLRNTASFYMLSGGASLSQTAEQLGISERWMYRYNKVVEEMNVQASDYSLIRIRDRRESVDSVAEESGE